MKDSERRRLEMFQRVRDFGAARAASFAAGTRGAELLTTVGQIVEELEAHASAQAAGASGGAQGTASRAAARAELREDLEAISRTARAMSFDVPGLAELFRLPRNNRNDQQLLAAARAFAADAAPLKADFIRHELPANFLEDLEADIAALEASITDQNRNSQARASATEAIDAAIERGVDAVRQLDAVVQNKFRDDPAALAAWTTASHTERVRARTAPGEGVKQSPAPQA